MDKDLFDAAQKQLTLVDVYMRNAVVEVDDSYEPHNTDPDEYDHQYRHVVVGTEMLLPEAASHPEADCYFRTLLHLGVRWGEVQKEGDQDEDDRFVALGKIEATFVAEYELADPKISAECLREFSFRAPSFHVWPYWREFVANTTSRCNVPKIVMPPMQQAQNAVENLAEIISSELTKKELFVSTKLASDTALIESAPKLPKPRKSTAKTRVKNKK